MRRIRFPEPPLLRRRRGRFTLARILNHTDREVTGIYDRYTYDDQKKRALPKWDRQLQQIIGSEATGKKVLSIEG